LEAHLSTTLLQSALPLAAPQPRKTAVVIGRILTAVALLFLAFDAAMKLSGAAPAVEATIQLGFSRGGVLPLGLIQLGCLALYALHRTAPIGAVLLTGYLGGAVAIHVQRGNPLLTHQCFPIYVGILVWGGLYLRDARVRALVGRTR
jgi:DoxX-like family